MIIRNSSKLGKAVNAHFQYVCNICTNLEIVRLKKVGVDKLNPQISKFEMALILSIKGQIRIFSCKICTKFQINFQKKKKKKKKVE